MGWNGLLKQVAQVWDPLMYTSVKNVQLYVIFQYRASCGGRELKCDAGGVRSHAARTPAHPKVKIRGLRRVWQLRLGWAAEPGVHTFGDRVEPFQVVIFVIITRYIYIIIDSHLDIRSSTSSWRPLKRWVVHLLTVSGFHPTPSMARDGMAS